MQFYIRNGGNFASQMPIVVIIRGPTLGTARVSQCRVSIVLNLVQFGLHREVGAYIMQLAACSFTENTRYSHTAKHVFSELRNSLTNIGGIP